MIILSRKAILLLAAIFDNTLDKLNCSAVIVMTFLTTKKLSRQVRDISKKTKGVIIITIALQVLLSSWYISRHGRLVQTSNNQAGPRGEKF